MCDGLHCPLFVRYDTLMKHIKHIAVFVLSIVSMGSVYAYPTAGYPDRVVLAQHRVVVRDVRGVQQQPRPRRFATQNNGAAYQRGAAPGPNSNYNAPPGNYQRSTRMSVEERSALRRQVNEANQGMYNNNRSRPIQHP